MPRQDTFAKPGRESLDLVLDRARQVAITTIRRMTVGPKGMLTFGRARLIEKAGLRDEHERPLRISSPDHCPFARCYLLERSPEVERSGPPTFGALPWCRLRERIIDFENCGCMTKALKTLPVGRRQLISCDPRKLPTGGVEQNCACLGKLCKLFHSTAGFNFTAKFAKICREGVGNRL